MAAAVHLTDVSRGWLRAVAAASPESRVVRPEGLHLTLHYLGPTELEDPTILVSEFRGRITGVRPFSVRLQGLGAFPSLGHPRAICVGVTRGRADLVRLGRLLAPGQPEITPHCTLARVGGRLSPASRDRLQRLADGGPWPLDFRCGRLGMFESITDTPGPARYRLLGALPLIGSASEGASPEWVE